MPLTCWIEGYLLVFSSIRPSEATNRQAPWDLIWVDRPSLLSRAEYGVVIVCGFNPAAASGVPTDRVSIDTAAFVSSSPPAWRKKK